MTIKEYLGINGVFEDADGNKMSHEEMYVTLVNDVGLDQLTPLLPTNKQMLQTAYEEDENLNTIPLEEWDIQYSQVERLLGGIGITGISMSECVCLLKRAARMHIQQ